MSTDSIKLSICIAYHNSSKYFKDTLDSITNQSYSNWEIVVCDNNSTEEEQNLLDELLLPIKDKVQLFRYGDIGTYTARWICYDNAQGDYILTCDADDYFTQKNSFISIVQAINKNNKPDIVQFDATKNLVTREAMLDTSIIVKDDNIIDINLYKEHICTGTEFHSLCTTAFNKNLLNKINCNKKLYLRHCEDGLVVMMLIDKSQVIVYLDEIIYFYRQHINSSTHSLVLQDDYLPSRLYVESQKFKFSKKWCIKSYNYQTQIFNVIVIGALFDICNTQLNTNKKIKYIKDLFSNSKIQKAIESPLCKTNLPERKIIFWLIKHKHHKVLYLYVNCLNKLIKIKEN